MKDALLPLVFVLSLPIAFAMENEAGVRVYTWEDYLAFLLGILLVAVGFAIIREYLHGASQR